MTPWHTDLPDADITVLMRLDSEEWPIMLGYYDGECWRDIDAMRQDAKVLGWMHFEDAAKHLDKCT